MLKRLLRKWGPSGKAIRLAVIIGIILSASGFYYVKASGLLSPGRLTAAHPNNEELGGVMSHADMEKECSHCHAPLHCVTDSRCQDCHIEIAKQRNDVNTLHGRLPGVSRCQNCHVEHQGEQASITHLAFENVDHYLLAGFSLAKHVRNYDDTDFTCTSCHSQNGEILETIDCLTCHSNADHDETASHIAEYGTACIECHDGQDRMVEGFVHDDYYPLQGVHANSECAGCHERTVYVGLPGTCLDCHEEPDVHMGMFGQDCARCHSEVAWAPAELKEHTFLVDHGGNEIQNCETCHAGTYTTYPCYSCHEDIDMQVAHAPHGIDDYQDCIACHPTGREGEAVATAPGPAVESEMGSQVGSRSITPGAADQGSGSGSSPEDPTEPDPGSIGDDTDEGDSQTHQPGKDRAKRAGRDG